MEPRQSRAGTISSKRPARLTAKSSREERKRKITTNIEPTARRSQVKAKANPGEWSEKEKRIMRPRKGDLIEIEWSGPHDWERGTVDTVTKEHVRVWYPGLGIYHTFKHATWKKMIDREELFIL